MSYVVHLKSLINFQLEVDSQVVGQKDMSRSAFDIWKEVRVSPANLLALYLNLI